MQLHDLSNFLSGKFSLDPPHYSLDDDVICHTYHFQSDVSYPFAEEALSSCHSSEAYLDSGEKENQQFRFAVFSPADKKSYSDAIILLHGLNERIWTKYLPWAYQLALQTQKPVIMFPIAYHINRSPQTWSAPRLMNLLSAYRKTALPEVHNSSFANVALSMRIDSYPKLFLLSGIQTYFDLIKLVTGIKAGDFNLFEKGATIHFFAYSIGALLTETLLISNPLQLFSDSRAFFFCGGSTFDKINGSSRAIMDSQAFTHLKNSMLNHTAIPEKEIYLPKPLEHLLLDGWKAFLVMTGSKKYVSQRNIAFKHLVNRIKAIGLVGDDVVPGYAIRETLWKNNCFDVDILDFPFKYSHETPFPLNQQNQNDAVTQSFQKVFIQASLFLFSHPNVTSS